MIYNHENIITMNPVEDFIYNLEGNQQDVSMYLHELLVNDLGLQPKIKFKIPFYYGKSWICYINPKKNDAVELAFTRGNELSNEQGVLMHDGRKQIAGIVIKTIEAAPMEAILETIHEAILLDETVPYQSKNTKM